MHAPKKKKKKKKQEKKTKTTHMVSKVFQEQNKQPFLQ